MIFFNSLDKIYEKGVLKEEDLFVCSVCGKKYKRESTAVKHFNDMSCHSYKNIFEGTESENMMYEIFITLLAVEGKRCISRSKFPDSRLYPFIAKFMLFCNKNKIQDQGKYLTYVLNNTYWKNTSMVLSVAIKETTLKEFRNHITGNLEKYDVRFFNTNKTRLLEDTSFVLRSLERGDISYQYLFDNIDFDEFVNKLNGIEIERLERFLVKTNE